MTTEKGQEGQDNARQDGFREKNVLLNK